ncbi:MAG: hypothetical protein AB1344_04190 [Pseudomonadota bacterium]
MFVRRALLPLACALLLTACGTQEPDPALTQNLPWQIEILPDGHSRVFGIVPGQTSLLEAKRALDKKAEVKLFKSADGTLSLELFYGRVKLGFLEAYLITEVDAGQAQLKDLAERASNPEAQPSGAWKYDLSFPDIPAIQDLPVRSLTYIPASVQFDAVMLEKRFGKPAERRPIDEGREYWLYPDKGLVVMLAEKEKELLQYVAPSDFPRLKDKISRELPRSIMD